MPLKRLAAMSLFVNLFLLLVVTCQGLLAQTLNHVVFSLGTFRNVSVPENATVEVLVFSIPPEVTYVTLAFHTQHRNATLSYTEVPSPGLSHTAVDVGLVSPLTITRMFLTWYLLSPDAQPLVGAGVVLPYSSGDPVPGGCDLGNGLNFDPSIHLQYSMFETTIAISPANVGHTRCELLSPEAVPSSCSTTGSPHARLEYDVYQYFLPKDDLSERSFLSHIERVSSVQGIRVYGTKVLMWVSRDELTATFSSTPGQGVIYSVVVRDPALNTSASYVPVHTYACSFSSTLDGCMTLGKISTKVFFTTLGLAGLFICFFGHRFFKCELFWMGYSFSALIFFLLITKTTALDFDLRMALTTLMGVVGGVVLVMSWWRFGSILCCIGVVGLLLGLLVACVIFTPIGGLPVFRSDAVFWPTYAGIVLFVPLIFLRWPREGSIVSCGVMGSYSVVLAASTYISTSLSYIGLGVLKRLFDGTFAGVGLRNVDYILLAVWVLLAVSGVVLQLYRERERPFFPPSPYLLWKQERERRKTNVLDPSHHVPPLPSRLQRHLLGLIHRREPAGERTPLLL